MGTRSPHPPDPEVNLLAQDIITSALGRLKDEIAYIFTGQESPEITIVNYPDHLNSSLHAVATAAATAADRLGIMQPWRGVLRYYLTFRLAYHLNSCEGLQLGSTCDLEDGLHHVLFVNYNKDYLQLYGRYRAIYLLGGSETNLATDGLHELVK